MMVGSLALVAVHLVMVYSWLVFPLLIGLLTRNGRKRAWEEEPGGQLPQVMFVLSAYNEETEIGGRIRNLLALDYPKTHWQAYVGVDGCQDRTADEARLAARGHANITVFDFPVNRGKSAVLKDLVEQARRQSPAPEILAFTDANSVLAPDALQRLCRPFLDKRVGGVCGRLSYVRGAVSKTEENLYWRYENWLKAKESAADSCLGANGAIYAIRTPLFWNELPPNTIVDDFVIGMKVREQNYRVIYEPLAVAEEELPPEVRDEWKRRIRIGAGVFQALLLCRACLQPRFGVFSWIFWSHKVLRWFTPHFMIAGLLLAVADALSGGALGVAFLAMYAAMGTAALLGRWSHQRNGVILKILRGVEHLMTMQVAVFLGFLRFCQGNLEGRWQRTTRG